MTIRIKILNRHHGHFPDGHRRIYIGRGSPLGNPYRIGVYGDRDTCIAAYESWLDKCISEQHHDVMSALIHIAEKAQDGGCDLICYCAPKRCHGDIIKEKVLKAIGE